MLKNLDSKLFGSIMLIAGTSIGAAMLAMPIATGLFGFFGSVIILFACWLFMYWMATLILEATLCFESEVSFFTMAKNTLGKKGALITWVTFLLLFYALLAAYISGSGKIIIHGLDIITKIQIPGFLEILPLLILCAPFIYFGLSIVDHVNRIMMLFMLISYLYIIIYIIFNININNLTYVNFSYSLISFSTIITGFGYHIIIPTLVSYLDRDIKKIKICLFYGSFIPLIIYLIWEMATLGSLPVTGKFGLFEAFNKDYPLAILLKAHMPNNFLIFFVGLFSLFAIITSFFGVSQGLFDFLRDRISNRFFAFFLTFVPPILIIIIFQKGFILLLNYAGALVSIVLGIIPILIVWELRKRKTPTPYQALGNNIAFTLGIIFFTFIILLVFMNKHI